MSKHTNRTVHWSKFRYLMLAGALLVTAAAIAVFAYFAVQNSKRVEQFNHALAVFAAGDYPEAERLLVDCVREDRNHEAAIVKLAQANEEMQRWQVAAGYWEMAVALNAFQESYRTSRMLALQKGRLFEELRRDLLALPAAQRAQYAELLPYAELMLDHTAAAEELLRALPLTDTASEQLQLAHLLLAAARREGTETAMEQAERMVRLEAFADSSDAVVAQEALLQLFGQYLADGAVESAEQCLKQAAALNPEFTMVVLGDFYFYGGRYAEACRSYQEALRFQLSTPASVRYAESLFELKRLEELKKLAPVFQGGDKYAILSGYYLEAMLADLQDDRETLGENLKRIGDTFLSPTAIRLQFKCGIQNSDAAMTLNALLEMKSMKVPGAIYADALAQASELLKELYVRQEVAAAAPLAEFVAAALPAPDLLTTRISLLHQSMNGFVLAGDIATALKHFPDDPVILTVATQYALRNQDFQEALQLAERSAAIGNASAEVRFLRILALEHLGRIAEAAAAFDAARQAFPEDAGLLKKQLAFVLRHGSAEQAAAVVAALPPDSPWLDLLAAEQAFRSGDRADMIQKLTAPRLNQALAEMRVEDLELLYHMAYRLAAADAVAPAIVLYEKLQAALPDEILVALNLSELYAVAGRGDEALRTAREVWRRYGRNPMASECYGVRLWEAGNYDEAWQILDGLLLSGRANQRTVEVWRSALEQAIPAAFEIRNYADCAAYCTKLLQRDARNAVGLEYQEKVRAVMAAAGESAL